METFFILVFWGVVSWACWHWFLHQWVESLGITKRAKAWFSARRIPDEAYYEQASREVRNGNVREGLWAKAWAQAEGDNTKAQALYIKLRVDAMKAEAARRFCGDAETDNGFNPSVSAKTVVACTQCGINLRMPLGKLLDVRCTQCGHEFRVDTAHDNQVEEYPDLKDQTVGRIGRLTFFWLWLASVLVIIVVTAMVREGGLAEPSLSPVNFPSVLLAALLAFSFAIAIARLRDVDKSGWWSLIWLIPFVNLALVLYLLVVPGSQGRNRFGPANVGFLNLK
ncbi:MAG: hypothetical protein CO125_08830 [Hydrogenophilales bacterium CG_4_9_14_3_um_filter_59_35]|nr:MAG: hypothetical protein COW70_13220 [Hydrogenophilales bacterium CG18_big_fil_WC_8_21_14_2_50_58_12]PIY01853.1 MAG: hypothetical protein COZ23_00915 [Hydrogenophilales bacterium CG_4_10_14_3_um_filter_58_23]PJB05532.1 MAG: hypothetical protein CO125_08830 [Hydrogenophilales bacterium CG_4_9_14_3_um_filter_59_35]